MYFQFFDWAPNSFVADCGGNILGHNVARHLDVRYVGLEKVVVEPGTMTSKEVIKLMLGRHSIQPGMRCALSEDLCNNFSTTDLAIQAIEEAGGQVAAIICGVNRSAQTMYKGLRVVSLVHKPFPQYKQTDEAVAQYMTDPGVVFTVKPNWALLEQAMAEAES